MIELNTLNIATCVSICITIGLIAISTLSKAGVKFLALRALLSLLIIPFFFKIADRLEGDIPTFMDCWRDGAVLAMLLLVFIQVDRIFGD